MKYLLLLFPVVFLVGCGDDAMPMKPVYDARGYVGTGREEVKKAIPIAKKIVKEGVPANSPQAQAVVDHLESGDSALAKAETKLAEVEANAKSANASVAKAESAAKRLPYLLVVAILFGSAAYSAGGLAKSTVVGLFPAAIIAPTFVFSLACSGLLAGVVFVLLEIWIKAGWLFHWIF